MKSLYLIFAALFFSSAVFAQAFNYDFSVYSSEYEDLVDANLAIDYIWDDPNVPIPLGFSFSFEGEISDVIYISDFGVGGILTLNPNAAMVDFLMVYSADIIDAGSGTGEPHSTIRYKTEGEAGNRVCKIEWKECGFYNDINDGEFPSNLVSFQLWLFENSNDFEIHFGPHTISESDFEFVHDGWLTTGIIQDINIFGSDFTMGHITTGGPQTPSILSSNDEFVLTSEGLTDNPSDGTVYRYGANFVSTPTLHSEVNWSLYPSRTSGSLTLQTGINSAVTYTVFDLSGRTLESGQVFDQKTLDVSNFESGIYLLNMAQGKNSKTIRFVKE